jgi:hypothetical protein
VRRVGGEIGSPERPLAGNYPRHGIIAGLIGMAIGAGQAAPTTGVVRTSGEFGFLAIACVVCGMIPLLWPADAPWINDEPMLLAQAWNVVHNLEIPTHGLTGSVGLPYGPVPVLIYSAALLFTHNLVLLVFLRAFFFSLAMGLSVWWLARMCPRLSPPVGALAMLSPYYWYYSRVLWDNSFLIPLSALTLVAYIWFCRTQAAWKFCLVVLGMVLIFQTHLMGLAMIIPVIGHFLWQYKSWGRKYARQCLLISTLGFLTCLPYLVYTAHHATEARAGAANWELAPWLFPLFGGRTFSALGLNYFFGDGWQNHAALPALFWVATGVSALGFLAFWVGLVEAWRFLMRNKATAGEKPLEFHLFTVVLATLVLQVFMDGIMRTSGEPHYYNTTSFCVFILVWLAYSRIKSMRWRWILPGLHAVALLTVLVFLIGQTHKHQGNTNIHYGPTLGTQLDILKRLDYQNPKTVVVREAAPYSAFPHAFRVLQLFYPLHYSTQTPATRLTIRYADPKAGAGRLVVSEVKP